MGDYPMAELGGKTPLQAAKTPHLDELARRGELGLARTIPPGKEPGSDIANLAIMGYDPARYHTGRAPLEAAALGVDLGPAEVAFRCNLVTLRHEDSRAYHGGLRRRAHHQRGSQGAHHGPGSRPGPGRAPLLPGGELPAPPGVDPGGRRLAHLPAPRLDRQGSGPPHGRERPSPCGTWSGPPGRCCQDTRSTAAAWRPGKDRPPPSGSGGRGGRPRCPPSRNASASPAR